MGLALASAAKEIYDSPTPGLEAIKQSALIGAGIGAGAAAGVIFSAPVSAALFGVFLGTLATLAVEKAWNEIPTMVQAAKAAGQSLMEATDAVADYVGQKFDDIYDATGARADHYLDEAAGLVNDIANGYRQLGSDINWAFHNPDAVLGELPDWLPLTKGLADGSARLRAGSPLVLDLDGDGVELAALNGTGAVYWDIDQDGFREASGWIAGGASLAGVIAAHPAYLYS